ncbi:hypothetical protein PN498_13030 [Oscillatoria sp. CS-180]|uniref:hypothetical protein n=1 Tax=Oscillatoria sp. CS-180 TaxID=3021720 RepID=UPI00233060A3|nr:hypothetical protein [Oscillatoria sp. CS-180]MDB9526916.1 hypothetical protein [Oscillatoria sp. CS-180]
MVKKSASLDLPSFTQSTVSSKKKATATGSSSPPVSYSLPKQSVSEQATLPLFPKAKRPNFSSHRNDANAALALNLLADVETAIVGWHQALRDTLFKIQQLYMAGPIIDGWLEAVNQSPQNTVEDTASVLRYGDAAQIAAYVEKLSQQTQAARLVQGTQYRLCSLDADGQMQCQICPPEQLGIVSQAIARNQQLRQLVNQKQYLEAKLKRASEALETTRQVLDIRDEI